MNKVYGDIKKIEILLSTYNGEKFVDKQLKSIEEQNYSNILLRIRDDGSSDNTKYILDKFCKLKKWVTIDYGNNIGVIKSFFSLLNSVNKDADFAAFCDQDDVWDFNKMERAVAKLELINNEIPALYFSSVRLVDENLDLITGRSPISKNPAFENAVIQNIAPGCTSVLNRAAINLLSDRSINYKNLAMHDWWVYLVVSSMGVVVYDEMPSMDYRQHGKNVIGASSGMELWTNRLMRFFKRDKDVIKNQISEFLHIYGDELSSKKKKICEELITHAGSNNIIERIRYAMNLPLYRQTKIENLLMRIQIIFGKC